MLEPVVGLGSGDRVGWVVGPGLGLAVAVDVWLGAGASVGLDAGAAHPAMAARTRIAIRDFTATDASRETWQMQFQRFDGRYQVRFATGESVFDPLLGWLESEGIGFATLTGIGAVGQARVSYWNAKSREYEPHVLDEQLEIVSLIGNATIKDGRPFLHIHVTLGRQDLFIVGGHLNDLVVNPNLEITVQPEATAVNRVLDEGSGLYVMDLAEHA